MNRLIHGPGFPFVAPFLLFMGLLYFRQSLPSQGWWLYGVSSLLVLGLLLWLRPRYRGQDPANPRTLHSVLLGLGAIVLWIALDPWMPRSGERNNAFPFAAAFEIGLIPGVLSILFRALGAVLIVPVVEELFWRGFLMRTIIKPEFEEVPLGTFQPLSFYITTLVFAAVHAEWGSAVLFGLIAGAWFCHTKSLRSVILLHAAANLGLTIYVLVSRQWFFW